MIVMFMNERIHTEDWNILIILDAMRYDFFKRYNTLEGTLEEVSSGATCTTDWLHFNFTEKYPYLYYSANPICNSKIPVAGFRGGDHFRRVVDVWKTHFNKEYNTVLPQDLTNEAIPALGQEKVILHYMQPHFPDIGESRVFRNSMWAPTPPNVGHLDAFKYYRIAKLEDIKRAYTENVQAVLEEVNRLVTYIRKTQKVVITADHGELLGEAGMRGHPCTTPHPLLFLVTWFTVDPKEQGGIYKNSG